MQALRGVDLSLYPGEIAVMMGHNGAGKSTLLRALIGLTPLNAGSIQVAGQDIAGRVSRRHLPAGGLPPTGPQRVIIC